MKARFYIARDTIASPSRVSPGSMLKKGTGSEQRIRKLRGNLSADRRTALSLPAAAGYNVVVALRFFSASELRSLRADVITQKQVLVAQVQFAVGDDRV